MDNTVSLHVVFLFKEVDPSYHSVTSFHVIRIAVYHDCTQLHDCFI